MASSFIRFVELTGGRVLNGSKAFSLELSKSAQAALLRTLNIAGPKTLVFNHVDALQPRVHEMSWPALIKPEQGGSGARMELVESYEHLVSILKSHPELWQPDNLLLLQEYVPYDTARGIVRMEFVGGRLLYAMRVVSHGRFNLCPAPVCNPEDGEGGLCETPAAQTQQAPVEFHPFPEVPPQAVSDGLRIVHAAGLDTGGIEYLEALDGRRVYYDINANSNLRPSVAAAFGFDPFERVVDFLQAQLLEASR
jgi:hypothetical protein